MWKLPHFCAEGSALLAPKFHRRNVFSIGYKPVEFRVFKHRIVVLENSGKHNLITRIIYSLKNLG